MFVCVYMCVCMCVGMLAQQHACTYMQMTGQGMHGKHTNLNAHFNVTHGIIY